MQELEKRLDELRAKDARADLKPTLQAALAAAEDDEERARILSRLASEWPLELANLPFDDKHKAKFEAAEVVIRKCIEVQPDDPYHWIRLAEHYHYYATDLQKALQAINTAIEKAENEKAFVRQAHGARIRIALELQQYPLVEKSLDALIAYSPPSNSPDVALEHDFLRKIPTGAVRDELVARYKAVL
jgi:tetratricopeptide (TPR) repeat protein